eukprot:CAMPEP_0117011228 /NCGR_PEP_ID=MMETSP0472-20121206/9700_1 /TAXON_ID=693140 ORGANISM="Tiarina fusus, Strain LIS" /NCGR_SAMPLE_ID=MMETSP0472 /ASSEMBLY_ACC=CAM_ASM_000603 /LENGTH=306 /DNA_ID=CAMNT_0004713971 /DNA_START=66 /DNA_END=986 /DNA_ORIENTATION=+
MKRVLLCKNALNCHRAVEEQERKEGNGFFLPQSLFLRRGMHLAVDLSTRRSGSKRTTSRRRTTVVRSRALKLLLSSPTIWLFLGVLVLAMSRSSILMTAEESLPLLVASSSQDDIHASSSAMTPTSAATWGRKISIENPMIEYTTNSNHALVANRDGSSTSSSTNKNNSALQQEGGASYYDHELDRSDDIVPTSSTVTFATTTDGKTKRVTTTTLSSGFSRKVTEEIIGKDIDYHHKEKRDDNHPLRLAGRSADDYWERYHRNQDYDRRYEQEGSILFDGLPGFSGVLVELEEEASKRELRLYGDL